MRRPATPAVVALLAVAAAIAAAGCGPFRGGAARAVPADSGRAFPRGVLHPDDPGRDSFLTSWYDGALRAMGEGALHSPAGPARERDAESYRFLWLRSFHRPVAVRAARRGAERALLVVEVERGQYPSYGAVTRRDSTPLDDAQWARLTAALAAAEFWRTRAGHESPPGALDGAAWVVEGRRGGRYHVVSRWSPEPSSAFHRLGLTLLELARAVPADSSHVY